MRLSIQNKKIIKRSELLNVPRGTLRQIKSLDKNRGLISDFVEKYAIRKCKKLKNRSKQQGKGDLRLSLSFCL